MSMQVSSRRDARQNQMNYFTALLTGGTGGLALKYAIPVNDDEKGIFQALRSEYTAKKFKNARGVMVSNLAEQNLIKKDPGVDLFVKMYQAQGRDARKGLNLKEVFKALSPDAKESFKKAAVSVQRVKTWTIKAYDLAASLVTKHSSRPTLGFMAFGATIGVLSAFWYNIFQKIIQE